MSEAETEARLADGRPVWAATPEEVEALKRASHRRAYDAAHAESERARQRDASVATATRDALDAGMPSASSLGVDISGVGMARARLIIGRAWIEHERSKIPELEQKRDAFVRALAMPDRTQAELAEIESKTTGALKQFYDGGSKGELPDLHRAEREVLIEKLALEDALAAECSAGLLEQAEVEIATQHRLVAELEDRTDDWLDAVIIEMHVAATEPKLVAPVEVIRCEIASTTAVAQVVKRRDLQFIAAGTRLGLGVPLFPGVDLEVPGGDRVQKLMGQWRKVRDALASDPRALVNAPLATRESIAEKVAAIVAPVVSPVSAVKRLLGRGSPPVKVEPKPVPVVPQELGYEFNTYRDSLTP
jgi:hypothetical protein